MDLSNIILVVNIIITLSALVGNGMVIVVMTIRHKQFSSLTNKLIRHQSIIDFISGAVYFLLKVVFLPFISPKIQVRRDFTGEILCRFLYSGYFMVGLTVSSTYNLVIISLERFMATCYLVKHRNSFTYFRIKVAMGVAWAIGFTSAVASALVTFVNTEGNCYLNYNFFNIIFAYIFTLDYLIPVTLMTFAYSRIFMVLRRKLADAQQQRDGVLSKAKRNVLETMLIAGIFFFICWTPLQVLGFVMITGSIDFSLTVDMYQVFTAIVTCNMNVNPVIYCFKYKTFRDQLLQLVRSRFNRNRVHTVESISTAQTQPTAVTQATEN